MKSAEHAHECRRLTPRQLEILIYVRDYRRSHGYSPTMQELADSLRITKVTVFEHVGALEKKRAAAAPAPQGTLFGTDRSG